MSEKRRPNGVSSAKQQHVHDVSRLARRHVTQVTSTEADGSTTIQHLIGLVPKRDSNSNHPYIRYALRTYRNLFLTFLFNWNMIFTMPFNTVLLLTVYPGLVIGLLILELMFWLLMDRFGGNALISGWSDKFGGGSPHFFSSPETKRLVTVTIPTLGNAAPVLDAHPAMQLRTFDLSIAQTLLILSALIYERDDAKVQEAFQMYASDPERDLIDFNDQKQHPAERRLKCLISESELTIKRQAREWGLDFSGVSELKSLGGPFAGIFWSTRSNFIVITFKGTTPTNYDEFLVDANIQRKDARSFLYGDVHEGFYDSLFPCLGGSKSSDTRNPYGAILSAIHSTAALIQRFHCDQNPGAPSRPVNIWVTGHSLGAALATALYARFLKSPRDLDPNMCVLRSGYLFGTPAIGDSDFAAHFASDSNAPYDAQTTLWRIVNGSDIICRLPPGVDDPSISMYFARQSIFNFAHVGLEVLLEGRPGKIRKPIVVPSAYQPSVDVTVVLGAYGDGKEDPDDDGAVGSPDNFDDSDDEDEIIHAAGTSSSHTIIGRKEPIWWLHFIERHLGANPIKTLESLYPSFFHNHLPYRYFDSLKRAREYVVKDEGPTVIKPNKTD
ncbi:Alpha/Beta hydrolase protein [Jimgerdemannia flammicorona]|uniref:Alpha/Beta hydrolase protein n=1 Tax=Jimgerdemannia flammicorona TaxID=994334 RepID=A0A433DAY9_9FUNG|nr:Alpha/Beta hydrolase protein [Jimgerdemannia flammicorona]